MTPRLRIYVLAFVVGAVLTGAALFGYEWLSSTSGSEASAADLSSSDLPQVTVYQDPNCGCCSIWADHMEDDGFPVEIKESSPEEMQSLRAEWNVPSQLRSCHIAEVDGYVVEGHVPPRDVKRMLEHEANLAGVGVPGMPLGSPGMESPNPEPYDVYAFDTDGQLYVFAEYRPDEQ